MNKLDYNIISEQILSKAATFGFLEASIAQIKIDLNIQSEFTNWLKKNFHGTMDYLARNTQLRFNPEFLHEGTLSIICVKMPYLTQSINYHKQRLANSQLANISSYALGRDYHKVVKQKLEQYAAWIKELLIEYKLDLNYRVFTDSAPILEVELAKQAGLGWRGKNTLLLNKHQGSMFFLGEIFTNLPLVSAKLATSNHCGSCSKCLTVCPTQAFEAPYLLNSSKCISYLTIENKGSIPLAYRKLMGNRIYGCDDCQLFCPWNKFARTTTVSDFNIRHSLDQLDLLAAFDLTESAWRQLMQGSPIYRIGYPAWLRNVAVALGNAATTPDIIAALKAKLNYPVALVQEHIMWALKQHQP